MERYSIEFLKKMDGQEDKHPVEPMRAWENMSDQKCNQRLVLIYHAIGRECGANFLN